MCSFDEDNKNRACAQTSRAYLRIGSKSEGTLELGKSASSQVQLTGKSDRKPDPDDASDHPTGAGPATFLRKVGGE